MATERSSTWEAPTSPPLVGSATGAAAATPDGRPPRSQAGSPSTDAPPGRAVGRVAIAALSLACLVLVTAVALALSRPGVSTPTDDAVADALDAYEVGAVALPVEEWLPPAFPDAPSPNAEYSTISGIRVLSFDDVAEVLRLTYGATEAGRPQDPAVLEAVVVDDGWSLLGVDRFVIAYRQDDLAHVPVVVAAMAELGHF